MAIAIRRKRSVRFNLRKKNKGGRIRLVVNRSNQHIYAQLIDDKQGITLAQASTLDKDVASGLKQSKSNIEAASKVGAAIAKKAKALKIEKIVFDRGGYLYHGRVKALADAARVGGLEF